MVDNFCTVIRERAVGWSQGAYNWKETRSVPVEGIRMPAAVRNSKDKSTSS
jgi:hypothetical protein